MSALVCGSTNPLADTERSAGVLEGQGDLY